MGTRAPARAARRLPGCGRRYVQVIALTSATGGRSAALGQPEWLEDPRFADNDARLDNRELVHERLAEVIATAPPRLGGAVNEAGGLCERLRGVEEAWRDPLLAERGLVGELDGGPFDFPLPVVSLERGRSR